MSDYEVTPELLAKHEEGPEPGRAGDQLQRRAADAAAAAGANSPKAYDGPPTDPKVFEETQKKLQEELQKRAEEQRQEARSQAAGWRARRRPPGRLRSKRATNFFFPGH